MAAIIGEKYVPVEVYKNIERLMEYRNVESTYHFMEAEKFMTQFRIHNYIEITGTRALLNLNIVRNVFIFLLSPGSKYASSAANFRNLFTHISKDAIVNTDVLIISESPMSSHINKEIERLTTTYTTETNGIYIESYDYKLFEIEIPKHFTVPVHEIMSPDETNELLKDTMKEKHHFAKIFHNDPMAIWIGARPGDMIRIFRLSESTGEAITYRLCIRG